MKSFLLYLFIALFLLLHLDRTLAPKLIDRDAKDHQQSNQLHRTDRVIVVDDAQAHRKFSYKCPQAAALYAASFWCVKM